MPHFCALTPRDICRSIFVEPSPWRKNAYRGKSGVTPSALQTLFTIPFPWFGPREGNAAALPALSAEPGSVTLCTVKKGSGNFLSLAGMSLTGWENRLSFFTVWGAYASFPSSLPLLPITLLARCEILESLPNQIFCFRIQCCQLLTEVSLSGTSFSWWGKKVHSLNNYKIFESFWLRTTTFCA
jgi:hypothetical protein